MKKAGKKAKCIKCGTILTIPVESDEDEVQEVRTGPPRKPSARDEDEADERPRKRRSRDDDDEDDDDRPHSRRARGSRSALRKTPRQRPVSSSRQRSRRWR